MISFQLNDMTCDHCVGTLTKALKSVDHMVKLRFDLAAHRVDIESGRVDAAGMSAAIRQAGYTPVRVGDPSGSDSAGTATEKKGCCCR
jgi:copper chaperone